MKKQIYYKLVIFLLCISCATKKNVQYRLILVEDYKKVYFKNCLGYGFNNSKIIREILSEDFSTNSDFIHGIKNYQIIDSLAKITNKEIKKDSINFYKEWNIRGKRVFSKCLKGYSSVFLDSMARSTYKLKR